MDKLLKEHKIILVSCVICTIVALFLFFFGNGPTRKKMKSLKREVADMEQSLAGMGMPQERQALEVKLAAANGARGEAEERVQSVVRRYEGMYRPMVEANNWTLKSFVQQKPRPSRDMYMTEYERIIKNSPFGDLDGSKERIGLSRDSDSDQRYRLVLQLWCLEKLLRNVHDKGLALVFESAEKGGRQGAPAGGSRRGGRGRQDSVAAPAGTPLAALMILPPVEIGEKGDKKKAEMLKLEFKIGVRGTMPQLTALVDQLGTPDAFFGIGDFEFRHLPPAKGADEKTQGLVQLNLDLLTFVNLRGSDENDGD